MATLTGKFNPKRLEASFQTTTLVGIGGTGIIPLTSLAAQSAYTFVANNTAGSASPTAVASSAAAFTFLATPSSANLASLVTGETGSGALVFGTGPTIGTAALTSPTITTGVSAQFGTAVAANDIAVVNINGGGGIPIHVTNAFLGLAYLATAFNGNASKIDFRSTQGTSLANLSPSLSGDVLGGIQIGGSHNTATGLTDVSTVQCVATENYSALATAAGCRWQWFVQANLTDAAQYAILTLDHDGSILAGSPDALATASATRTYTTSGMKPAGFFGTKGTQTFKSTFATPSLPTAFRNAGIYMVGATSPGLGFFNGFHNVPTVINDAAVSTDYAGGGVLVGMYGFREAATVTVDTATGRDMGGYRSFSAGPTFNRTNSGTFTAGYVDLFVTAPVVSAGVTLTQLTHFGVGAFTGTGAVTTQYGLNIPALTGATTNIGIFNGSSTIASGALYGQITSGGSLTVGSTTHATKGKILFGTSGYDEVNNRLGIGNSTPTVPLDVTGAAAFSTTVAITGTTTAAAANFSGAVDVAGAFTSVGITNIATTGIVQRAVANPSLLDLQRIGAASAAVLSTNVVGNIRFGGYDGTSAYKVGASIVGVADENFSTTAYGEHIGFFTALAGGSSPTNTERWRIHNDGTLRGTTAIQVGGAVTGAPATGAGLDMTAGMLCMRVGTMTVTGSGTTSSDVTAPTSSYMKITQTGTPGAFTIDSIAGGVDGALLIIQNSTGQNMTLKNDSGGTAANRIRQMAAGDFATTGSGSVVLVYDAGVSRWQIISTLV